MATIKDKIEIEELPAGKVELVEEVTPELTVAELQQEIFNVKLRYDSLLNYLKPLLSHDALVLLAEKKKEIFA
jgi:hypothetical protein